jgi:hypothetical protein
MWYRLHAIQGNDYGLHINLNEVQQKLFQLQFTQTFSVFWPEGNKRK